MRAPVFQNNALYHVIDRVEIVKIGGFGGGLWTQKYLYWGNKQYIWKMPKAKTPKTKRKIERGKLGAAQSSIKKLKKERLKRIGAAVPGAATGALTGAALGAEALMLELPGISLKTLAIAGSVGGSVLGAAVGMAIKNEDVRLATERVGYALATEAKKNTEVKKLLNKFRYVIIDWKGNIVGTNRKRILKIGRFRLSTADILYNMRKWE